MDLQRVGQTSIPVIMIASLAALCMKMQNCGRTATSKEVWAVAIEASWQVSIKFTRIMPSTCTARCHLQKAKCKDSSVSEEE